MSYTRWILKRPIAQARRGRLPTLHPLRAGPVLNIYRRREYIYITKAVKSVPVWLRRQCHTYTCRAHPLVAGRKSHTWYDMTHTPRQPISMAVAVWSVPYVRGADRTRHPSAGSTWGLGNALTPHLRGSTRRTAAHATPCRRHRPARLGQARRRSNVVSESTEKRPAQRPLHLDPWSWPKSETWAGPVSRSLVLFTNWLPLSIFKCLVFLLIWFFNYDY